MTPAKPQPPSSATTRNAEATPYLEVSFLDFQEPSPSKLGDIKNATTGSVSR